MEGTCETGAHAKDEHMRKTTRRTAVFGRQKPSRDPDLLRLSLTGEATSVITVSGTTT
jgi:hypothetical protein